MSIAELPPLTPCEAYTDYVGYEYCALKEGSAAICGGCGRRFVAKYNPVLDHTESHGYIGVQDHGRFDGGLGAFCSTFCAGRIFERYVRERAA